MRAVLTLAVLGLIVYCAIAAYLALAQRRFQYHPADKGLTPASVGLAQVETLSLPTPDGETLVAWHAKPAPGRPTVLFLPGNAGEIGDRSVRFGFYQARGLGVLFLSYRGFGGSTGSPSEPGLIADADAAHGWLLAAGAPAAKIVVIGESLGTGVAVRLAARRPVAALVLEAPYTAAVDVARLSYWWLPVGLLMTDQFRSADWLGKIAVPTLVVHGTADALIPFAMGRAVYQALPGPKEFMTLEGGGHGSVHDPAVWAREVDFIDRLVR